MFPLHENLSMKATVIDDDGAQSKQQPYAVWPIIVADRGTGEIGGLPGMAIRWAESDFAF